MSKQSRRPGRHYLQIPGPTLIPERVQSAMSRQILDHRGREFQILAKSVLEGIRVPFRTKGPVIIFPSSGTGAWEAALTNTLSPGDKVLMVETGQFGSLWAQMARRLGLDVQFIETDWRVAADPNLIEAALRQDKDRAIKAVCVVHNETSTGCLTRLSEVRGALDAAGHPAMLMVDAISSLACTDVRHDEWHLDVTVAGSQKGMMLPPGLSFTAVSDKALRASKSAKLPRSYFCWDDMLSMNADGFFPYTPATGLLYGVQEVLKLLEEEGLEQVYARHERLAEATRRAVQGWGLDIQCRNENEYSPAVTTVVMPKNLNADAFRQIALEKFNMSLGTGLNRLAGKAFRIGHLGDTNELTILGALAGIEMSFDLMGVPHNKAGLAAAMSFITETSAEEVPKVVALA